MDHAEQKKYALELIEDLRVRITHHEGNLSETIQELENVIYESENFVDDLEESLEEEKK